MGSFSGGSQIDVFYTDFEEAYDKVDYNLFIIKLEKKNNHKISTR